MAHSTEDRSKSEIDLSAVLLLLSTILIPLLIIMLIPGGRQIARNFWFWVGVATSFWVIWLLLLRSKAREQAAEPEFRMLMEPEQPSVVRDVMRVKLAVDDGGIQTYRGRLVEPASAAYPKLKEAFAGQAMPLLQEDDRFGASITLLPGSLSEAVVEKPVQLGKHWLLFFLTFLTTTWAGALHQGVNLLQNPGQFMVGLPYSLGLLGILGFHEMGHYFAARWHGMRVTPPYFIPVPFALGTFGAFIRMRSPPEDRRGLFDMAIAGPLAGLVIALPALYFGLKNSTLLAMGTGDLTGFGGGARIGSSVMFAMVAKLAVPEALQYGHALRLSPLAFAGWLGLLVTALNLLPVGQLDGGHIARSMFGNRVGTLISNIAMWSLILLAVFVWPALMMWALIVFFIARRGSPPLNDVTPITAGRRCLGYLAFLILGMILMPVPWRLVQAAAAHCPYL